MTLPPKGDGRGDLEEYVLWVVVAVLLGLLLWNGIRIRRMRRLAAKWRSTAEWRASFSQQQLRSSRLEAVMEGVGQERARVARELHDNLGSLLATMRLYFYSMDPYLEGLPVQMQQYLRSAAEINEHSLEEIRRMAHTYAGDQLAGFDLVTALQDYLDLIAGADELEVFYEVVGREKGSCLAPVVSMAIFRVAQELICNVLRHAAATRLVVRLAIWEGGYRLVVIDDGCGFAGEQAVGMGLANVADRVAHLNGQFQIYSVPGAGTWGGVWG